MSATEEAVVTETKPETTTTIGKKKKETTGDLILDVAHEVEGLTKQKALNEADRLFESGETNHFKLGGVLFKISENSWHEGFESFDDFVYEKYGFQGRKARYLMSIYNHLVTKMIPWNKVSDLGWTKLKDLAPVITPENVDEWAEKAKGLTVVELQALIKAQKPSEGDEKTAKTTDEVVKITFKLKPDQAETVTQALAKGKGEMHTEYDTVALENICAGYLGDTIAAHKPYSLDQVIEATGFEAILEAVAAKFTEWDIKVVAAGTVYVCPKCGTPEGEGEVEGDAAPAQG